eukprot:COSAG03_NODE_15951_length_415_cov_1.781646_1_plen_48_part_10
MTNRLRPPAPGALHSPLALSLPLPRQPDVHAATRQANAQLGWDPNSRA